MADTSAIAKLFDAKLNGKGIDISTSGSTSIFAVDPLVHPEQGYKSYFDIDAGMIDVPVVVTPSPNPRLSLSLSLIKIASIF